ncbi:MAG: M48 family metalloprotease [Gemmataceae bacterium]|nr:M48 family metalloprotease [Gemmataceae bacterium]
MRRWLKFFYACYTPFIAFLALLQLGLAVGLIVAACVGAYESVAWPIAFWIVGIFCFLLFCWFLAPMYYFFTWHPEPEWIMDLKVSRDEAPPLYELMDEVAQRCRLPVADEIRLSPLTDAAVYQTKKGRQVLLIGALTVASFPRDVVGAIMAHELCHIESGDTATLRDMLRTRQMMAITRAYFMAHPYGYLHPFVWFVFVYQFLFDAVFAAASRRWEYAADQAGKRQAGERDIAIGLFCVHVTPHIEGASMDDLLQSLARTRSYTVQAFSEQVSNVRAATKKEWKRAMRDALWERPGLFGDHPSLSARLKAVDVDPEEALAWALKMNGNPMSSDIRGWPELEKKLTIRVLTPYLRAIEEKQEIAAILKAF